ncbi:hypothetical protein GO730_28660 [Spirosoma sp. HMF3257]|uniref:Uncharacterized protein n=1 Tax=Spirosoma telluris TaxID=2183553 RepID=A0A327NRU0_9BACT|nr:hypothetical protein [Spirosoma telluris]RAI77159.1 hypothetical protein HMF3257_28595 [Spirosoma telluris]
MNTSSQLRLAFAALLFTTVSFATQAQTKKEQPVAKDGFWVVETAPKSKKSTVRFYTNEQKMIYEETVDRSLNIARRQTKEQLNVALEQALFVWNATHQIPTDRQWVSVRLDRK